MPPFELPDIYVPKSQYARPGLIVKQTLLKRGGKRLEFKGLFTLVDIPKNAFVGFYTGEFYDEYDDESDDDYESHYAMSGSGFVVIPPGENDPNGVDPAEHPLSMMNEPPRDTVSNVSIVEWRLAKDAVPGIRPNEKVGLIAFHACRDIRAGDELYFYYGDQYDRRHYGKRPNVGGGCKPVKQGDVPTSERPRNFLMQRGVEAVPEGLVYIRQ